MELLEKFGINWGSLIAQAVNFLIVLAILYAFAYKPILRMLDARSRKIAQSLKDAEETAKIREEIKRKKEEEILKAQKEGQRILEKANLQVEKNEKMMLEAAKKEVAGIISEAHQEIEEAKEKMLREAKKEIADVVVLAAEKILQEKIDAEKQQELIKQALKEI